MYEALDTCLLTYCILISKADAITASFCLFAMIVILGDVTGGHFNPAVTIGVLIWQFFKGDTTKKVVMALMMIVSQVVGLIGCECAASFVLNVDGRFGRSGVPKEYEPVLAPQNTIVKEGYNGSVEDFKTFFHKCFTIGSSS